MPTQALTIHIPIPLYEHLKQRAEESQRSIEEETLEVLATAIPMEDVLSTELKEALESLESSDDDALWQVARTQLAVEINERLESLHAKKRREGLTEAESAELVRLLQLYERQMLMRAKASAVLKQRGHDVSGLLP